MRICIYTAIYGDYDDLLPQARQGIATDFVCYTDSPTLRPVPPWHIVRDPLSCLATPRLRAKWLKLHPHVLFPRGRPRWRGHAGLNLGRGFPRYDITIWIDGNIRVTNPDFARDLAGFVGVSGMAMFRHPDRDCVYDEAETVIEWSRAPEQLVRDQVAHYRKLGFPPRRGLPAATVIARSSRAGHLQALSEAWWEELQRWSLRDQLSLPVVLDRLALWPDWIDGHLWFNRWYERPAHKREDGVPPA